MHNPAFTCEPIPRAVKDQPRRRTEHRNERPPERTVARIRLCSGLCHGQIHGTEDRAPSRSAPFCFWSSGTVRAQPRWPCRPVHVDTAQRERFGHGPARAGWLPDRCGVRATPALSHQRDTERAARTAEIPPVRACTGLGWDIAAPPQGCSRQCQLSLVARGGRNGMPGSGL